MLVYVLFVFGFFALIKGADWLVEGAASIARRFNIPNIVIGLTIVAFGTSAPEFIVNIFASLQGNSDIAIGNVLGSNIANILLILGVASIIYPLRTPENTVWKEIPLSLLAAILLAVLVNDIRIDGADSSVLSRSDGMVLLAFFMIFLYYTFSISKSQSQDKADENIKEISMGKSLLFVVLGLLGLTIGGKWIVDGAVSIAAVFDMPQSVVGLTLVAIGTSLPELATSAVAAFKKQPDIAIGNVVGSNIFNIFWILGASAVIRPLPFNSNSDIDVMMVIFASVVLFALLFIGHRHTINRWQGYFMLAIYIGYLYYSVSKV
jgi:cation:H+ antiporter